ncbi:MAG TPA: ABC transporter permease subunit [Nocardioidaceae bacterium]|nr:ABC transporter permease subunit [Nocardioidaceae bacterium]
MLSNVFAKTLYDERRSLVAWVVSVVLLVALYVAVWPSVRDQPAMSDFLEEMPEAFRALFATAGADMSTPVGYIQIELLSFMGPLLVIGYAVAAGGRAIAGEEERHTLDLVLATSLSRTRLVLEKGAAMAAGVLGLAAVTGVALVLEGSLADMGLGAGQVSATMLHLGLLGLVFGALALAVSGATGHLGAARAVPAVAAVVAYLVNGLAPMVDWLEPLQKASPFYWYVGHDPLRTGVDTGSVLLAVGTSVLLFAVAAMAFRRRDIAT